MNNEDIVIAGRVPSGNPFWFLTEEAKAIMQVGDTLQVQNGTDVVVIRDDVEIYRGRVGP